MFPPAPVRHMALGVPGGSFNKTYFVLCGGGLTAALVYVSIGEVAARNRTRELRLQVAP